MSKDAMHHPDSQPSLLNLAFADRMLEDYIRDRSSVSDEWRSYFDALGNGALIPLRTTQADAKRDEEPVAGSATPAHATESSACIAFFRLIDAYRRYGHLAAAIDPLKQPRPPCPALDPAHYGLTHADLDQFVPAELAPNLPRVTGRELITRLHEVYCRAIGTEFMHMDDDAARDWVRERLEGQRIEPTRDEQLRAFNLILRAAEFDQFVRRKYIGAKSFSLEGSESLIPLLDTAISSAGAQGVDEVVIGMAHRGRLNVLVNVMDKRPRDVFREFQDEKPFEGHGDVKYHLGASTDRILSPDRKIHLSLSFNPSHLEFINPVVCGRVRAKQDREGDMDRRRCLAVQIHGDAAFAGQGVVQETLNLSQLNAYHIGGSLHVVVNNQIGFTTETEEARSTTYASDIARMLAIPIFHVNGDDLDAVCFVARLAVDFQRRFSRDVVIDLYGYRRLGHNEGDEPSFTQPIMYDLIHNHPTVEEIHGQMLIESGILTAAEREDMRQSVHHSLDQELAVARSAKADDPAPLDPGFWRSYHGGPADQAEDVGTCVEPALLRALLHDLAKIPRDFHLHPRLTGILERRAHMAQGERPLDWATAEALAFATLALQGVPIRLTGQDTARGTFSQRHAVLHDVKTGRTYAPLMNLKTDQAPVLIANSPLSEIGVLGFEFGYSLDYPDGLTLWEAQYGDFINAGQVIVDQFLTTAEVKWKRLSGLVLLLPHGLDGQGPEHSSARLERFLMLSAEDNIQIVNASTPAQYFHVLRRQALRRWRKPLVILAPKRLLRDPHAVSALDELSAGRFAPVLPDSTVPPEKVRRLLLCSGKIYYELNHARENNQQTDIAIVRLEQLHPLPRRELESQTAACPNLKEVRWVQEEPQNMGAWWYMRNHFGDKFANGVPFVVIARPPSSTPATGSLRQHKAQQVELIERAFLPAIGALPRKARATGG